MDGSRRSRHGALHTCFPWHQHSASPVGQPTQDLQPLLPTATSRHTGALLELRATRQPWAHRARGGAAHRPPGALGTAPFFLPPRGPAQGAPTPGGALFQPPVGTATGSRGSRTRCRPRDTFKVCQVFPGEFSPHNGPTEGATQHFLCPSRVVPSPQPSRLPARPADPDCAATRCAQAFGASGEESLRKHPAWRLLGSQKITASETQAAWLQTALGPPGSQPGGQVGFQRPQRALPHRWPTARTHPAPQNAQPDQTSPATVLLA